MNEAIKAFLDDYEEICKKNNMMLIHYTKEENVAHINSMKVLQTFKIPEDIEREWITGHMKRIREYNEE